MFHTPLWCACLLSHHNPCVRAEGAIIISTVGNNGKRNALIKILAATALAALLAIGVASQSPVTIAANGTANVAVGPQYDTTHVYVAPEDFDRFVASLIATFGGITTKQGVFTVTPTPSKTMSQLVLTPVGTVSVFGFKTPIPYPFGAERTGYLVTDLDAAIRAAR